MGPFPPRSCLTDACPAPVQVVCRPGRARFGRPRRSHLCVRHPRAEAGRAAGRRAAGSPRRPPQGGLGSRECGPWRSGLRHEWRPNSWRDAAFIPVVRISIADRWRARPMRPSTARMQVGAASIGSPPDGVSSGECHAEVRAMCPTTACAGARMRRLRGRSLPMRDPASRTVDVTRGDCLSDGRSDGDSGPGASAGGAGGAGGGRATPWFAWRCARPTTASALAQGLVVGLGALGSCWRTSSCTSSPGLAGAVRGLGSRRRRRRVALAWRYPRPHPRKAAHRRRIRGRRPGALLGARWPAAKSCQFPTPSTTSGWPPRSAPAGSRRCSSGPPTCRRPTTTAPACSSVCWRRRLAPIWP